MPTIGPGFVSVLAQDAVKSPAGIIRSDVIHQPVLPIGNTAEIAVAIEKNMWNLLGVEFQVELPDVMVCLFSASGPVHIDHEISVVFVV